MGKPMVSTSLGCEGVTVRDGEHLLIADEPEAFAAAVGRLFEDRPLAAALGSAGRERMEQEYSWEVAGARLEELYRRVVGAGRADAPRAASVEATSAAAR
jgi:polysaccharide biosynthesis protein PslH